MFTVTLTPPTSGVVEPFPLEVYTDIGGQQSYFAFLDAQGVAMVSDSAAASASTLDGAAKDASGLGILALVGALAVGLVSVGSRRR